MNSVMLASWPLPNAGLHLLHVFDQHDLLPFQELLRLGGDDALVELIVSALAGGSGSRRGA